MKTRSTSAMATAALAAAVLAPLAVARPAQAGIFDFTPWGVTAKANSISNGGWGTLSTSAGQGNEAGTASASASLRDAKLHVSAISAPEGISYCKPYDYYCHWGVSASAMAYEAFTVSATTPGVTDGVINYSFDFDGAYSRGRYWGSGGGDAASYFGTSLLDWYGAQYTPIGSSYHSGGSLAVRDGMVIYWMMGLAADAEGGASADYSNTGKFSWTLPEGFKVTSASGQFLADLAPPPAHAPEPAAWTLMLAGFGLAGAGLRRRGRVPLGA